MPKFSHYFSLNSPQSQLDFVDISTDYDTSVYIDPYAIEINDDIWSAECSELIRSFFLEVLNALRNKDDAKAKRLMSNLHEPAETFLGVSENEPNGKGFGKKHADQFISRLKSSRAFKTGLLTDLSEVSLFVVGIGRDKISDLTTNIIRRKLIEYTNQQCEIYGIEVDDYNAPPQWDDKSKIWVSKSVKVPYVNGKPVILIPKYIVRREMTLTSQGFYNGKITDYLIAEQLSATGSLVQNLTSGPKVTKKDVREKNKMSKDEIADFAAAHPEILDIYKDISAKFPKILSNISKGDLSIEQTCIDLKNLLSSIPPGKESADSYHTVSMHILTACLYPHLIQPHKEWNINDGRKRIDIVYTNASKEGFFSQKRDAHKISATVLIVECKNYSKDIANPELDQLLGRFDDNRGYLGFLLCRSIDKPKELLKKCRDYAKSSRAYILVFTDNDLIKMLDYKIAGSEDKIEGMLYAKFSQIIA